MRMIVFFLCCLLLPVYPAMADNMMHRAAAAMGREINRQVAGHFGEQEGMASGISLIVTTPVDLQNLEESNAIARQMQEELSLWFIQAGYGVREIRQGKGLLMRPSTGELLLTRNKDLIPAQEVSSALTLVGTYTLSSRSVTFNIRLVRTGGQEVYAMSSIALPISGEMRSLISAPSRTAGYAFPGLSAAGAFVSSSSLSNNYLLEPSVFNRLP